MSCLRSSIGLALSTFQSEHRANPCEPSNSSGRPAAHQPSVSLATWSWTSVGHIRNSVRPGPGQLYSDHVPDAPRVMWLHRPTDVLNQSSLGKPPTTYRVPSRSRSTGVDHGATGLPRARQHHCLLIAKVHAPPLTNRHVNLFNCFSHLRRPRRLATAHRDTPPISYSNHTLHIAFADRRSARESSLLFEHQIQVECVEKGRATHSPRRSIPALATVTGWLTARVCGRRVSSRHFGCGSS